MREHFRELQRPVEGEAIVKLAVRLDLERCSRGIAEPGSYGETPLLLPVEGIHDDQVGSRPQLGYEFLSLLEKPLLLPDLFWVVGNDFRQPISQDDSLPNG